MVVLGRWAVSYERGSPGMGVLDARDVVVYLAEKKWGEPSPWQDSQGQILVMSHTILWSWLAGKDILNL